MMGAELTVASLDPDAPKDTMAFLKEISSNGNVQTTDVLYPMLPFFLYLSPSYMEALLEPTYKYQASGLYRPLPAAHDIGNHYPNATGHSDYYNAPLPVEESADMIIMALALVQASGNSTQAERYYELLFRWAMQLKDLALIPAFQLVRSPTVPIQVKLTP